MITLATSPLQQARVGVVTGTILTKNQTPAAGVRVSVVAAPGNNVGTFPQGTIVTSVLTDDLGRYRLEEIPPGNYYITSGLLRLPSYYPGVAAEEKATVIAVTAGKAISGVDFAIAIPSVTVSGRVALPPNRKLSGTGSVTMLSPDRFDGMNQNLKADGSFQFSGVSPGSYTLVAHVPSASQPQASGSTTSVPANPPMPVSILVNPSGARTVFVSQIIGFGMGNPESVATSITVADQDITGLVLTLPSTVPITGRVIVEGNQPVPDLSISFVGASRATSGVQRDGTFWAQLIEGEYRVVVGQMPSGYFLKSTVSGKSDLAGGLLRLSGSDPVEIVVTLGVRSEKGVLP
jgi:hypothetical protein